MLRPTMLVAVLLAIALVSSACRPTSSSQDCGDTSDSVDNCGACGRVCAAQNATASCVAGECILECLEGAADCDGDPANGCEAVLADDPANCRECGRGCEGSTCAGGVCEPRTIGTTAARLDLMAVAGDRVVAVANARTAARRLVTATVGAGAFATVTELGQGLTGDLQADDTGVYFAANITGAAVIAIDAGDGSSRTLATTPPFVARTASGLRGTVYFSGEKDYDATTVMNDIYAVPRAGGTVSALSTTFDWPLHRWLMGTAVSGDQLVVLECQFTNGGPCALHVTDPSSTLTKLLDTPDFIGPLAANSSAIYYYELVESPLGIGLWSFDRATSTKRRLAQPTLTPSDGFFRHTVAAFAVSEAGLYLADGARVVFFPVDGSDSEVVVEAGVAVTALATRGPALFWAVGTGPSTVVQQVR